MGLIFLGYRNDYYRLSYQENPISGFNRKTTHYAFSFGFFTGIGGADVNTWVTNGQVSSEYDGMVWSKGIALIAGVRNFTVGAALGWDNLLDKNHIYWIYHGKPWLGLAFGLNIN